MTVQERIEELRLLHGNGSATPWDDCDGIHVGFVGVGSWGSILGEFGNADDAMLTIVTRNLLPVLLAAWELAEAEQCYREHVTGEKGWGDESPAWDDQQMELSRILKAARKSYREALKGVEDE